MDELRPYLGQQPQLGKRVYIDRLAVITGKVCIGDDSSIWSFAAVRNDAEGMIISIGNRCCVQEGAVCHVTPIMPEAPEGHSLLLGDDVIVGHQAMLHGCTIGNRVLIGMKAMVMDGAVIEDEVLIAAGTVVPPKMQCQSGYLYMGNPAKSIRRLTETEIEQLTQYALIYVENKDRHIAAGYDKPNKGTQCQ